MQIGTRRLRLPSLGLPQPSGRGWRLFKALIPLFLIAVAVYLFYNFPAIWDTVRYWIDKPKPANTAVFPPTTRGQSEVPVGGLADCGQRPIKYKPDGTPERICDNYVYIPNIRVAAPIVYTKSPNEAEINADLLKGVVHYPGTAEPGQKGNVFLTGHSSYYWWVQTEYRNVFALLPQLITGDEIIVYNKGIRYTYKVYGELEVPPTETSVLRPTTEPELTLSTCVPLGTSYRRHIVRAKQVSPNPASARPASNQNITTGRLPGVR